MPNPPSIPSHENVFGYEENDHGDLIKQKNAEKVHTGVGKDTVGPGTYDVVKNLTEGKKGPSWHLPKHQKKAGASTLVDNTKTTVLAPGPGHYNAEKVDIFPIYKYKPSSVFVSKVGRDQKIINKN